MLKGFSKLSVIALVTIAVLAIYTYLVPKFDYSQVFSQDNDSLLVIESQTDTQVDSLGIMETPAESEPKAQAKKKKYVKKIKPVTFSEIVGGDDFSPLTSFFDKITLFKDKRLKKLRLAYFGDSITESDLGTNRLRQVWQDSLGGKGVGFVPAVSELSQFRASIRHTYSPNWQEYSIRHTQDRDMPLGIAGNVAIPSIPLKDSLVSDSTSISSHTYSMMGGNWLAKPTLILLNNKAPLQIEYLVNKDTLEMNIDVSDNLQFISLSDSLVKYISIAYYPQDTCFVYGVDFSDDNGIYIDNYSLRGNKGNNFIHLNEDILRQFYDYFEYDLTILHYGANVTDPIMKDYSWYRISMKKNIRYLKTIEKTHPMILFSVGDRGAQLDTLWVSSPDLPYLIKEQKRIAQDTEIGFFNLFTALGGEKSNVSLHDRALLTPDHTHFTRKGARFFGDLLFTKFYQEYQNYLDQE